MDTPTALAQQSDRRIDTGRDTPYGGVLAAQVLAMHERDHQGSAKFCTSECCQTASRTAGRG